MKEFLKSFFVGLAGIAVGLALLAFSPVMLVVALGDWIRGERRHDC